MVTLNGRLAPIQDLPRPGQQPREMRDERGGVPCEA